MSRSVSNEIIRDYRVPVGSRPINSKRTATEKNALTLGLTGNTDVVRTLGEGFSGSVFLVRDGEGWWALKLQAFTDDAQKLQTEVYYQRRFWAAGCAPPVADAWLLKRNGGLAGGVIKMAPVDAILAEIIAKHKKDPVTLAHMAAGAKRLLETAKAAKLVHGDAHFENMALALTNDRLSYQIVFIDFGKSLDLPEADEALADADSFWAWRDSAKRPEINPFMQAVSFPGSSLMQKACGSKTPSVEVMRQHRVQIMETAIDLLQHQEETRVMHANGPLAYRPSP